ncbi:hypothetical protein RJT34_25802 [Clitoria ternatea]|uniref:Uncharacterized protein n=1 Tax=Clitoria ternatea TaxID=43366 RepID=A0AAN9IKA0_CLITE
MSLKPRQLNEKTIQPTLAKRQKGPLKYLKKSTSHSQFSKGQNCPSVRVLCPRKLTRAVTQAKNNRTRTLESLIYLLSHILSIPFFLCSLFR